MSDELQEAIEIQPEVVEQVDTEIAPEEAPAEGEKLSGYDKRISVLTARLRDKEQRLAQLEAAQETKAAMEQEKAPEVPDIPDPDLIYSDPAAYKQQLRERDIALTKAAAYEARQAIKRDAELETKTRAQEAKRTQTHEIVSKYIDNGLKSGITEDRMLANEKVLQSVGINPELAQFLFSDENGAKLVDHLARNPEQLAEIAGLPPTIAAVRIATEIKPKALATKSHVTNAPDPNVLPRGGGKPPTDPMSKFDVKGATFE